MNDKQIEQILRTAHTVATVGLSTHWDKPSCNVPLYLKSQGYRVIPVNPKSNEIMGEKSYPDLLSVPEKIDVVQIFRPSKDVPPIVDQAIQMGAKVVWMQEGIKNHAAAKKAQAAGLQVVMDRCMGVEHRRLIGMRF